MFSLAHLMANYLDCPSIEGRPLGSSVNVCAGYTYISRFCSCNLDFDPMTVFYEVHLDIPHSTSPSSSSGEDESTSAFPAMSKSMPPAVMCCNTV